jgi:hypothetical protein
MSNLDYTNIQFEYTCKCCKKIEPGMFLSELGNNHTDVLVSNCRDVSPRGLTLMKKSTVERMLVEKRKVSVTNDMYFCPKCYKSYLGLKDLQTLITVCGTFIAVTGFSLYGIYKYAF